MACLNCTARVLRVFIHSPLSPAFSPLRQNALQKPLLQRYPERLAQFQQLRGESTYVTSGEHYTDDDYIPFDFPSTSSNDSVSALHLELPVARQIYQPPPPPPRPSPPVAESSEPDIVLTNSGQEAADSRLELETSDSRLELEMPGLAPEKEKPKAALAPPPLDDFATRRAKRFALESEIAAKPKKPDLGVLDMLVAKKAEEKERQERQEKDSRTTLKQKRTGKWELPPLYETPELQPQTRLQRYIAETPRKEVESWRLQKAALQKKFGQQKWDPVKRLSPEAVDGIRTLHSQHPNEYPTERLSALFEVSPEAIRRILRSRWQPDADEAVERMARWERRGQTIWNAKVEVGEVVTKGMKRKIRQKVAKRQGGVAGTSMSLRIV